MHDLLVRSFQTYPELPPLELEAKNPIALRKAPLNKRDANLFQGAIDLATASPEEIPKLIREVRDALSGLTRNAHPLLCPLCTLFF